MEKRSIRFITLLLVLSMLFALSLTAFAGSASRTVKYKGYNCTGSLYVNKTHGVSAFLDCVLADTGLINPEVSLWGIAYDSNGKFLGDYSAYGTNSASTNISWDKTVGSSTCYYEFTHEPIMSLDVSA